MRREDTGTVVGSTPLALFCARLKRLQQAAALTQTSLAKTAGLQKSQMSAILNGGIKKRPDWNVVKKVVHECLLQAHEAGRPVPPDLLDEQEWRRRYFDLEQDLDAVTRPRRGSRLMGERDSKTAPQASPAGTDEVCLYLTKLITWLDRDPWPRDPRLGGPALSPARIERKLMVRTGSAGTRQDAPADDLASRCTRLVVLGSSGSGKTWLAKRAARRCAEAALDALVSRDAGLDEVELPLFTTCSLLSAAAGGIRDAVLSSALDHIGDLGGIWTAGALRMLFAERQGPTLLVIDSLDEARNPDGRLREVDDLPWRIVLTSRPGSWKQQLDIKTEDPAHWVGELLPLRYPEDVEAFVGCWFESDRAQAQALVAQIASREYLQQAATVPLILAFYCIIGRDIPLPETRNELYAQVLWRLLSGLWRDVDDLEINPAGLVAHLRSWAWAAARKDRISGIGTWADEILTEYVQMSRQDRAAVDHVAMPIRPPDLTGATARRFIHRSIREHLTAAYIATQMSASEATAELLNHLWYDPDWEYAAPAALAMHPDRNEILQELIRRAARSKQIPDNLAHIDPCWEVRLFLLRVARESRECDWTAGSAAIIGRARLDIAANNELDLAGIPDWPSTGRQILRDILTELETGQVPAVTWLAHVLCRYSPETEDVARARNRVLELLETGTPGDAKMLSDALNKLNPEPEDLAWARNRVLGLLDTAAPTDVRTLSDALGALSPGTGDLARARNRVLELLETGTPGDARMLSDALNNLNPEPEDLARTKSLALIQLRALCDTETCPANGRELRSWLKSWVLNLSDAVDRDDTPKLHHLTERLIEVGTAVAQAGSRALDELQDTTDPLEAAAQADYLAVLGTDPADLAQARNRLLDLLRAGRPQDAEILTDALTRLNPGPRELARLLDLLDTTDQPLKTKPLADAVCALSPQPEDLGRARTRILNLLDTADLQSAPALADALSVLSPQPEDLGRARTRILNLLDTADLQSAPALADALSVLSPQPEDLGRARTRILNLLDTADLQSAPALADALSVLSPQPEDLARARTQVLSTLDPTDPEDAANLADALAPLGLGRSDLARVGYDGSSWPRHDGLKWPRLLVVVGAGMVVSP